MRAIRKDCKMIGFDSHTHSIMSGHAFSTVEEMVAACPRAKAGRVHS